MSPTVQLALAGLLGLCGWQVFKRLNFPLAAILGPMAVVGIAGCLGLIQTTFPPTVKLWLQITVGVFAGCRVDRQSLGSMRAMLGPIGLAAAWLTLAALLIGYLLSAATPIDLTTGLLGASPGGLAEMSALAVSLGGDVAIVAALQSFRLISTYLLIPAFARRLPSALPAGGHAAVLPLPRLRPAGFPGLIELSVEPSPVGPPLPAGTAVGLAAPPSRRAPADRAVAGQHELPAFARRAAWLAPLALGAAGAYGFVALHVPGAGVIGSMTAVVAVQVAGLRLPRPPMWLRNLAKFGLGVMVGTTFTPATAADIAGQFTAVVLVTLATLGSSVLMTFVVQRLTRLDPRTAALACAPAGLAQMAIIADEMGAEPAVVTMFQTARMIVAVMLLPTLVGLLRGG